GYVQRGKGVVAHEHAVLRETDGNLAVGRGFDQQPGGEACRNSHLGGSSGFVMPPEWWPGRESNPRHGDFQSPALPTELPGRCNAPGREAAKPASARAR